MPAPCNNKTTRDRSHPHIGATRLEIVGLAPTTLTGIYWTDRLTLGDMDLRHITRRTGYSTLAAAKRAAS